MNHAERQKLLNRLNVAEKAWEEAKHEQEQAIERMLKIDVEIHKINLVLEQE